LSRQALVVAPRRSFAAKHVEEEKPGKASFRKTGNPSWYNKRF
jgi:hypothetical protein